MTLLTPFQTIGPFFEILLRSRVPSRQLADPARARRITIEGVLLDGEDHAVSDGLIETWQADAEGRYAHPEDPRCDGADPAFFGHGWCHTDEQGRFAFVTLRPGAVPGPDGRLQAPHILVSVMARGVLTRYVTRLYFDDEPSNGTDAILALVPEGRRATLLARTIGPASYRFDIRLQGASETVFFDV